MAALACNGWGLLLNRTCASMLSVREAQGARVPASMRSNCLSKWVDGELRVKRAVERARCATHQRDDIELLYAIRKHYQSRHAVNPAPPAGRGTRPAPLDAPQVSKERDS
jgi:hypothetical protein